MYHINTLCIVSADDRGRRSTRLHNPCSDIGAGRGHRLTRRRTVCTCGAGVHVHRLTRRRTVCTETAFARGHRLTRHRTLCTATAHGRACRSMRHRTLCTWNAHGRGHRCSPDWALCFSQLNDLLRTRRAREASMCSPSGLAVRSFLLSLLFASHHFLSSSCGPRSYRCASFGCGSLCGVSSSCFDAPTTSLSSGFHHIRRFQDILFAEISISGWLYSGESSKSLSSRARTIKQASAGRWYRTEVPSKVTFTKQAS